MNSKNSDMQFETVVYRREPVYEDEISLIDLWLVLVRRRKVFFGVLLFCVIGGFIIAVLTPKTYLYSTSLEIGNILVESDGGFVSQIVDEPDNVLAKLKESYIPLVISRQAQEQNKTFSPSLLSSRIPKGSQLVIIEAKGTIENNADYLQLLTEVSDKIIHDHKDIMNVSRRNLESRLNEEKIKLDALQDPSTTLTRQRELEAELVRAQIELEALKDPLSLDVGLRELESELKRQQLHSSQLDEEIALLEAQYNRVDDTDALLKEQIDALKQQVATALEHRSQLLQRISDEAAAMAILLIDNQIQENRQALAELEERLLVGQKNLRDQLKIMIADNRRQKDLQQDLIALTKARLEKMRLDKGRDQQRQASEIPRLKEQINKLVADNQRAISMQQHRISELETHIDSLKETRVVAGPIRSLSPLGPGLRMVVMLSIVLGLIIGVFAAFFAEFIAKARSTAREKTEAALTEVR